MKRYLRLDAECQRRLSRAHFLEYLRIMYADFGLVPLPAQCKLDSAFASGSAIETYSFNDKASERVTNEQNWSVLLLLCDPLVAQGTQQILAEREQSRCRFASERLYECASIVTERHDACIPEYW